MSHDLDDLSKEELSKIIQSMEDDHVEHEEHDEHIDERWLVSYADMMTLLFGLFVLLYSIATMDKKSAEKIIESTKEKFGTEVSQSVQPEPAQDLAKLVEELRSKNRDLASQADQFKAQLKEVKELEVADNEKKKNIEELKQKNDRLEENLKNLQVKLEKLPDSKTLDQLKDKNSSLEVKVRQLAEASAPQKSNKKIIEDFEKQKLLFLASQEKLKSSIQDLIAENKKMKIDNQKTQRNVSSVDQKEEQIKALQLEVEKAAVAKKEVQSQRELLAAKVSELSLSNKDLSEQLIKSTQGAGKATKAFLAVFINWSTKDHDIDLVVKDPQGRKFDFKNRKYAGQPGFFALDTRRGPGAELWQTDRIIPGRYTATYSFYNQYGNTEPAKVSGTIYSAKGSYEIKPVLMDVGAKKEYRIEFEVQEDGDVQIISSKH